MKSTLVKRITFAVLAVLALVIVSSSVALLAAFRSRSVVGALHQSLLSTRAAEELEISLLEQRGVVSAYLLDDGNSRRLAELPKAEKAFDVWLERSREHALAEGLQAQLHKLDTVYDRYIASRNRVIELYDAGHKHQAAELLLTDVNRRYAEAYVLCEAIISNNELLVDAAVRDVDWSTRVHWWLVFATALISGLLALWLLHLLVNRILLPLRSMIDEASSFQLVSSGLTLRSPDDELRTVGFYLRKLMTDVTDARTILSEQRERLRRSESLASVGKLASCVAHEIRNPLTAINMWLFSVAQSLPGRAPQSEMIGKALHETRRLEHVVQHFLEFARPPELQRETVRGTELIDRALELVHPLMVEKELQIDKQISHFEQTVHVDAGQLTQVISNLLMNAVDASRPGQSVRIRTEQRDTGGAKWHVVRISDEGSGIPAKLRERVFEPFFTTKSEGTGLGLCIAANIMVRHRGRLLLESSDDRGTVFSVWIPIDSDRES